MRMRFASQRDEAIAMLNVYRAQYSMVANRTAGWDRKLQSKIMQTVVKYAGGSADPDLLHLEFLDALIGVFEAEAAVAKIVNRVPINSKIEELA